MCRSCGVEAEKLGRDGRINRISCPSCGVFLEGEAAAAMFGRQTQYQALKEALEINRKVVSVPISGPLSIRYRPRPLPNLPGPFMIGPPKDES